VFGGGGGQGGMGEYLAILCYGLLNYFYVGKTHPIFFMFLLSVNMFITVALDHSLNISSALQ
jgi:hypothetical protein